MAKPPHIRLTWSGTLGTASPAPEIWSMGLGVTGPIDNGWLAKTPAEYATLAAAVRPAWGVHFGGKLAPYVKLTRTRASSIGGNGRTNLTTDGAYRHGDDNTVANGSGSANGLPFQVALAVSLRSAKVGPTGKGRFYLPTPDATAAITDGLIAEVTRDALATSAKGFVDAVNTALETWSTGCRVAIISGGSVKYGTPGEASIVTQVGVGRAFDTMRSRRGDLAEEREYMTVT